MERKRKIFVRIIIVAALGFMMVAGTGRKGEAAERAEEWTYKISDGRVALLRYTGTSEKVSIYLLLSRFVVHHIK